MPHVVTLVPGDGTGPELTEATRRVLEATGVDFTWDIRQAGVDVMESAGTPLPPETLDAIKQTGVALKGPITTPIGTGFRSVNVALRHELGLYACVRPCKTYRGVRSRYEDVDLVVIRENTEDLYAGIEFESGTDDAHAVIDFLNGRQAKQIAASAGISIKPLTPEGSERIIRFAFDYARANGRRRVSCITKANIMKHTDGLFLAVFREVAKDYPDVEAWETLVDALCMGLVQRPEEFDVLVLPNLYGDIVSDLTAGLVGGLGVAPGANIGTEAAVFEATHGSAPKYTGQNRVNPTAMILSGKLMLEHLGERDAARRLEEAVAGVIADGERVTYDLKPRRDDPTAVGTSEYADAIIERLP
jgi:isocitrate dehydrogenase (NAD+)